MLKRMSDGWEIACDECGHPKFLDAASFTGAIKMAKKEDGWVVTKDEDSGEYKHLCFDCREY
jgi:hypothetical protein